jgi:hypothetical protein
MLIRRIALAALLVAVYGLLAVAADDLSGPVVVILAISAATCAVLAARSRTERDG